MKKHIGLIAIATLTTIVCHAQEDATRAAGATNQSSESSSIILEPSGAEPAQTPGYQPVPVDASSGGTGTETQVTSTITISRTITNLPNTITIIGTVDNEQQKQNAQTRLQEVFQGKTINNLLIVSNDTQSISEPSGAERPSDADSKKNEQNDSSSAPQSQE